MAIFSTEHAAIHYLDLGPSQAQPALMLVHGFPLDGHVWDDVADILQQSFRVVVPDLPGFGRSTTTQPFSMQSLAADLKSLAAHLGLGKFVIAGLSMGGYVALQFAKDHPALLAGLALVDTRANADDETGKSNRDAMAALALREGAAPIVEQMFPKMLAAQNQQGEIADRLRQIMLACPPQTIAWACEAMRDRQDFVPLLSQLKMPVQIIVGESDAITPVTFAESMDSKIVQAETMVIEEAGHMAPLERPAAVAAALADLMKRV